MTFYLDFKWKLEHSIEKHSKKVNNNVVDNADKSENRCGSGSWGFNIFFSRAYITDDLSRKNMNRESP